MNVVSIKPKLEQSQKHLADYNKWMKEGAIGNALNIAERHLPHKIKEAASVYYDMWVEQKAYGNALDIAEKHLPDKVIESASVYYDMWMEQKAYGNALNIAEKYFPERVNKLVYLNVEDLISSYEKLLGEIDPDSEDGNILAKKKIAPMLLEQARSVYNKHVDGKVLIVEENGSEVPHILNLEERIESIHRRIGFIPN
jgi:hypothetical protein